MTLRSLRRRVLLGAAVLGLAPALALAQAGGPAASATPTVFANPKLVQQYQATITADDLAAHLYLFASDYFEGRETGTRGQKLAAYYLASQYRKMGLQPKGSAPAGSPRALEAYLQPFPVYGQRLQQATLTVKQGDQVLAQSLFGPNQQDGQAYLAFGGSEQNQGEVVFAGYGIQDDELGYNDFAALKEAGLDVGGKWLLILRDEPLKDAETSLLKTADGKPSRWSRQSFDKLRAAIGSGFPAGVLIVDDAGPRAEASVAERAAQAAAGIERSVGNLSLNPPKGGGRSFPPVYNVSTAFANKLLAAGGKTVEQLQAQINAQLKPVVMALPGVTVESRLEKAVKEYSSENVVAFIEGSDPVLKDEVVVVSSHYDHIGVNAALEGDQINNGADDDGSGTVTTLEIAEAFMQAKRDGHGPRRSVLFLNVSGEEKGLLGSAYYADVAPAWPLDKTVTNLNIDMIGRFDPTHPTESEDYVYIIGSNLISQELHDINLRVNDVTGTRLELSERFNSKDDPNRFYARSDHWNFGKHGVPFIFFFTGTHEDYHQPGDEPHKIAYERMARIAQLIFATAWQVANQDAPPAVSGTGFN